MRIEAVQVAPDTTRRWREAQKVSDKRDQKGQLAQNASRFFPPFRYIKKDPENLDTVYTDHDLIHPPMGVDV